VSWLPPTFIWRRAALARAYGLPADPVAEEYHAWQRENEAPTVYAWTAAAASVTFDPAAELAVRFDELYRRPLPPPEPGAPFVTLAGEGLGWSIVDGHPDGIIPFGDLRTASRVITDWENHASTPWSRARASLPPPEGRRICSPVSADACYAGCRWVTTPAGETSRLP
jgi:hypothetical protein